METLEEFQDLICSVHISLVNNNNCYKHTVKEKQNERNSPNFSELCKVVMMTNMLGGSTSEVPTPGVDISQGYKVGPV
jgi:hypothetical protein